MRTLWSDLRHGWRLLARRPVLTATTVLVLALGLGATAALFSLVNGLLLKSLPGIEEPERLVLVGRTTDGDGFDTFGYPEYLEMAGAGSLTGLVAEYTKGLELRSGEDSPRWVTGSLVTGNYFSTLGTGAAVGRLLRPEDSERVGAAPVAVLAHRLAVELFGSAEAARGRAVRVNGLPFRVVGVAAEGFRGHEALERIELWIPLTMVQRVDPPPFPIDLLGERGVVFLSLFGRLAPGATPEGVEAELAGIMSRLVEAYPDAYEGRGVAVAEGFGLGPGVRSYVRGLSTKLLAVVLLVLVVVCANVANLQLARISDRRTELGVRLALGADRWSLVRQVLVESVMLALMGGAAGLVVAAWSGELLQLLVSATPLGSAAEVLDLSPDVRVYAAALALAVLAGLAAGLGPALVGTRTGAAVHLARGGSGRRTGRSRLRDGLVVAQIGLSLVLLVLAGLHLRSIREYRQIDPGFDADRVWTAGAKVGGETSEERNRAVLARLVEAAQGVPGVEAAAVGRPVPLAGSRMSTIIRVPGWEPPAGREWFEADVRNVSPGYFDTMGLTLLRGRGLEPGDGPDAARVAVVNQTMAERFWPGRSPVGETFSTGRDGEPNRVVGVVSDMKYLALDEEPRLHFYRPFAQNPRAETVLHVRAASGDPAAVGLEVRRVLADAVPEVVLFGDRTLAAQLDRSIGTVRMAASATTLFGGLALLLAAAGLAGTLLYYVRTHRHEIGVRMALGADARRVVALVVGRGMRRVLLGLALGVPVAWAAADALGGELYGVDPTDPRILAAVAAGLLATAVAAALPAAVRASRSRPAEVLRQE